MTRIIDIVQKDGLYNPIKLFEANDEQYEESKAAFQLIPKCLSKEVAVKFLISKLTPTIFDKSVSTTVRSRAGEIGLILVEYVNITDLPQAQREATLHQIEEKYVVLIGELSEKNYIDWDKLWTFLIKLCNRSIHQRTSLTNKVLRTIEVAFRNSTSVDHRIKAYKCWTEWIHLCSLDPAVICSPKQLKILITPMKAKFSRMPIILEKRCETFVYLLEMLGSKATLCLSEFLEYCFGPFDDIKLKCSKHIPRVLQMGTKVLVLSLGHHHINDECLAADDIKVRRLIQTDNFASFYQIVVNSAIESCLNLNVWCEDAFSSNIQTNVISCIWRSICILIKDSSDETYENALSHLRDSMHKLYNRNESNKYAQIVLGNLIQVLIDMRVTHSINDCIFTFILDLLQHNVQEKCPLNIPISLEFIDRCLNGSKQAEYFDLIAKYYSTKCLYENIKPFFDIWWKIDLQSTSSNNTYLLWAIKNLNLFTNANFEKLSIRWMKLYESQCKLPTDKYEVIKQIDNLFQSNPFLSMNIIQFLGILSDPNATDFEFIHRFIELVVSVTTVPSLNEKHTNILTTIVLSHFDQQLDIYKSPTNGNRLIEKLCQCLQNIVNFQTNNAIISDLTRCLKNYPPKNLRKVSNLMMPILDNLVLNDSMLVSNDTRKLIEILDPNKDHKFKGNRPSDKQTNSRSMRMVNMASNDTNKNDLLSGVSVPVTLNLDLIPNNKRISLGVYNEKKAKHKKRSSMPSRPLNDDKSDDFVKVLTEVKFDKSKLSEHQKEVLKSRRDDIPSLYEDLTKDGATNDTDAGLVDLSVVKSLIKDEENNEEITSLEKLKNDEQNGELNNIETSNALEVRKSKRNVKTIKDDDIILQSLQVRLQKSIGDIAELPKKIVEEDSPDVINPSVDDTSIKRQYAMNALKGDQKIKTKRRFSSFVRKTDLKKSILSPVLVDAGDVMKPLINNVVNKVTKVLKPKKPTRKSIGAINVDLIKPNKNPETLQIDNLIKDKCEDVNSEINSTETFVEKDEIQMDKDLSLDASENKTDRLSSSEKIKLLQKKPKKKQTATVKKGRRRLSLSLNSSITNFFLPTTNINDKADDNKNVIDDGNEKKDLVEASTLPECEKVDEPMDKSLISNESLGEVELAEDLPKSKRGRKTSIKGLRKKRLEQSSEANTEIDSQSEFELSKAVEKSPIKVINDASSFAKSTAKEKEDVEKKTPKTIKRTSTPRKSKLHTKLNTSSDKNNKSSKTNKDLNRSNITDSNSITNDLIKSIDAKIDSNEIKKTEIKSHKKKPSLDPFHSSTYKKRRKPLHKSISINSDLNKSDVADVAQPTSASFQVEEPEKEQQTKKDEDSPDILLCSEQDDEEITKFASADLFEESQSIPSRKSPIKRSPIKYSQNSDRKFPALKLNEAKLVDNEMLSNTESVPLDDSTQTFDNTKNADFHLKDCSIQLTDLTETQGLTTRRSPRFKDDTVPTVPIPDTETIELIKSQLEPLITSPVNCETPNRNLELIKNTNDISPIKVQANDDSDTTPVLPNKMKRANIKPNLRVARLLQLANPNVSISMDSSKWREIPNSPSSQLKKRKLKHEEDLEVLTFSREIPSPLIPPRSSILKRKMELEETALPSPKRKRVNFSDPAISDKRVFIKDTEDETSFGDLLDESFTTDTVNLDDLDKLLETSFDRNEMIEMIKTLCNLQESNLLIQQDDFFRLFDEIVQDLPVDTIVDYVKTYLGAAKEARGEFLPHLYIVIENLDTCDIDKFFKRLVIILKKHEKYNITFDFILEKLKHATKSSECYELLWKVVCGISEGLPKNKSFLKKHLELVQSFVDSMNDH